MENFLKKNKRGTLIRDPPESMREYTIIMLNMVEYACIYLNRQSSEYARILHVFDTVHSVRPLSKLLSSYWDRGVFRTLSNIEMKPFARMKMTKNNQARNQKFLKAGEVSLNLDTSINNSSKTRVKKAPWGNILEISVPDTLKTTFWMEN